MLREIYIKLFPTIHLILPYRRVKSWHRLYRSWYSLWLKPNFKEFGNNVYFEGVELLSHPETISIGDNTAFSKGLFLTSWPFIEDITPMIIIGKNCSFGAYNHITCANKIEIGEGVLTGKWVTISDNSHGKTTLDHLQFRPQRRPLYSKGPVIIGDNVWIGDKVTILPGVTIGNNAVIGANTVVTKDVPAYSIAVGNPCKIITV